MWREQERKTVKLTRRLAEKFRDMEPVPRERPLGKARCAELRAAIAAGTFRAPDWATVFCEETGKTVRVNGQHTSTVCSDPEVDIDSKDVKVCIAHYVADTLADVSSLYSTFDLPKSARNTGDINRVYAGSNENLSGISSRIINLCVTGIAISKWGVKLYEKRVSERAELILVEPAFAMFVDEILKGDDSKILKRSGVVSAIYVAWLKSHEKARQFFVAVRDGTGKSPSDPSRYLQKVLLSTSVLTGNGARTGKRCVGQVEIGRECVDAWNAWRAGLSMEKKPRRSPSSASEIEGFNRKLPIAI